jgi:hypothetical protein
VGKWYIGAMEDSIDLYSKLLNKSFMGFMLDGFGVFWSTDNISEVYKKILRQKLKNKKIFPRNEVLIGV